MNIQKRHLTELKPLSRNARRHGARQIEHFVRSLNQFGQTRPFVIDEKGTILVGNGMHAAMTHAGGWDLVDCHVVTGLSEAQKKKLILSDNKVFQLGEDDFTAIDEMLTELAQAGDFDIAGYDAEVLESMVKDADAAVYDLEFEEEPRPRASAGPAPQPVEVQVENFNPAPTWGPDGGHDAEYEEGAAAPVGRRVTCPHCGEAFEV